VAVTDEAIERIKAMILSGDLRPGDRLPREADLALALGVSRNSLREAVRALSLVRILDVRQGDGTYVTSLEPSLLLEALSFVTDVQPDADLLQFLEVRRILEPAATAMAARRITDTEVAELSLHVGRVEADTPLEDFLTNDSQFHARIAAIGGNRVLASLLETVTAPTRRARAWRALMEPHAQEQAIAEHREIVSALGRRQPDEAAARALLHVAGIENWLRDENSLAPP